MPGYSCQVFRLTGVAVYTWPSDPHILHLSSCQTSWDWLWSPSRVSLSWTVKPWFCINMTIMANWWLHGNITWVDVSISYWWGNQSLSFLMIIKEYHKIGLLVVSCAIPKNGSSSNRPIYWEKKHIIQTTIVGYYPLLSTTTITHKTCQWKQQRQLFLIILHT